MNKNRKAVLPLILIFIFLNTLFIIDNSFFKKQNIDNDVLVISNAILFVSNLITLLLLIRALQNSNPNVFVRSMMAGTVIKLFVIAIAFIAYAFAVKRNINKPAIYISIFLYFLYLAVEVGIVLKLNKQKNA
jgi:hypothetical protein